MNQDWHKYRKLLWPFTLIYGVIISVRNWAFDVKILKSKSYFTPIINVGNIAVGGTGKTPHIEYLIRLLNNEFKIATLSRGYKRKTKGFILAEQTHTYSDIGDEPKQLKSQFNNVMVCVDENRRRGIELLENRDSSPDIILLDDAFQHRYVKPGLNLLLTDYFNPYWNDQLLPVGNLRDSKSQVRRADIVIVSKTPKSISPIKKRIIKTELKLFPFQNLFFTTIDYGELVCVGKASQKKIDHSFNVFMLTGIAKSLHLKNHLSAQFKHVENLKFGDHHDFNESDIETIIQRFEQMHATDKIIITTYKDAVRLKDNRIFERLKNLPIYYQSIKVGFLNHEDEKEFNDLIKKYARNAKRDRRLH
ncbi:MAG: tetraacyldisaccharide 4'-kinase [Bacteroidales bacterium]|nr:tetraacyldisaccharide 4'-kinase [Bacteroidales bacterium]